jgi:hypothetical protein
MELHEPQYDAKEDLAFKPVRSFDTTEQRIALLLHGVVPVLTLIWSLIGAYWMWRSTFGSGWMAVIAVLVIESIGIFGMALTVLDLTESRFWRQLRFVLPIIPSFSFAYLIHDRVMTSAVWLAPMSARLGVESDIIAWGATAGLVLLLTAISWWSWRAFEEAMINPESIRKRSIYRDYVRRQRSLDVQQYEMALRKQELDRQRAAMIARIEATIQMLENRIMEMLIELRSSRSALAQLRATRDALDSDAALSHDLRELPDAIPRERDDGGTTPHVAQSDRSDAIADLIEQSDGAHPSILSMEQAIDLAIALHRNGVPLREIERRIGISRRTIQRRINRGPIKRTDESDVPIAPINEMHAPELITNGHER